jgi:hypothetical protein
MYMTTQEMELETVLVTEQRTLKVVGDAILPRAGRV